MYIKLKDRIKKTTAVFIPKDDTEEYGNLKVISIACTSMSFVLTPIVVHTELF